MRIKLSQSDWEKIGIKMGWMKTSGYGYGSDSIMGYTWDADEHSVRETQQAIKDGILKVTDPEARLDEHGIPESGVEDSEGNEIHPIFAGDQEEAGEIEDHDEDEDEDEGEDEFSYLTEGHEDNARMVRLRQMAESLVEDDDSFEVHAALYWLLSHYHGGQYSPEYAALSSSPYNPGPMESGPEGTAKFIYDQLEQVFKG